MSEATVRKVYLVTSGYYSAYGIEHVFATRRLAEAYIASFGNESAAIEEWDVVESEASVENVRALALSWRVWKQTPIRFHGFSTKARIDIERPCYRWYPYHGGVVFIEIATNPNHPDAWWIARAEKVAQDMWAFVEYERTVNGLSVDEINPLLARRDWAKEATADD